MHYSAHAPGMSYFAPGKPAAVCIMSGLYTTRALICGSALEARIGTPQYAS